MRRRKKPATKQQKQEVRELATQAGEKHPSCFYRNLTYNLAEYHIWRLTYWVNKRGIK